MSRDLWWHIITSIHTVLNKYLSKDCFVDWNAHKVESDLYSMMWLARIQERDFFENEYSAKYKFKWDRKSAEQINPLYDKNKRIKKVDKELEYKKECRKELFSLLEKHIDILWR